MASVICETGGHQYFTEGDSYTVLREINNGVLVIDDEGNEHSLTGDFLEGNFKRGEM
jgi:peptide subunit release factor RF-3